MGLSPWASSTGRVGGFYGIWRKWPVLKRTNNSATLPKRTPILSLPWCCFPARRLHTNLDLIVCSGQHEQDGEKMFEVASSDFPLCGYQFWKCQLSKKN